jgi:hypothetical protein
MLIRDVWFCAVLVFTTLPSQAATILFSNLIQPGNQYGPDGVGIGHTPSFTNPGDYLLYGVHFTASMTAQLTTIEAPLGVISGPNQIQAFLMTDSGGAPATVIESFALTGLPIPPGPFSLFTINSSLDPLLLTGHQYWFVATGGPNTFASWTLNLFQGDPIDGGASQLVVGGVTQPWTVGTGTRTGALQIYGNPVPEPSYPTLVGCAILFLGLHRIRQDRRSNRFVREPLERERADIT